MEMKCYKFKDSRRIFKLIYSILFIFIANVLINALAQKASVKVAIFFIPFIIFIVVYKLTRQRVYIGDIRMEVSKVIPYMTITNITATDEIKIACDNRIANIKIIDIESNYDKYRELLDTILSKVDEKVAEKAGSAEDLLDSIKRNREERYKVFNPKNGKPVLGGWLKAIMVIEYLMIFYGVVGVVSLIVPNSETVFSTYQMLIRSLISITIVVLMHKRKSNVKYALAAGQIIYLIFSIIHSVKSMQEAAVFFTVLLEVVSLLLAAISFIIYIKIYFEYIDNFDRPKNTLIY